jgi:hypothetical protein
LTTDETLKRFEIKFFGALKQTDTNNRRRKESYFGEIRHTYNWFGFDFTRVKRIWVCWKAPDGDFQERLEKYNAEHRHETPVEVVSFQNLVIPELMKHVKTAHYEDVSLRTLSLLRQCKIQGRVARENNRQRKLPSE